MRITIVGEPQFAIYTRRDANGNELRTGKIDVVRVPILAQHYYNLPDQLERVVNSLVYCHVTNGEKVPVIEDTQQLKQRLIAALPRVMPYGNAKHNRFKVRSERLDTLQYRVQPDNPREVVSPLSEEDYIICSATLSMYAFYNGVRSSAVTKAIKKGRIHMFWETGIQPRIDKHCGIYLLSEVNGLCKQICA